MNPQLNTTWHELLFGIRRSIRYHDRRRRFFDTVHTWLTVLLLVSSTGAVATLLSQAPPDFAKWFAGAIAVLSVVKLVVAPADRGRCHHALGKEFRFLEADMTRCEMCGEPTAQQVAEFVGRRLRIECDEPPKLAVLDCVAHNDMVKAMGYAEDQYVHVSVLQRLFMQCCDLWPSRLRKGAV